MSMSSSSSSLVVEELKERFEMDPKHVILEDMEEEDVCSILKALRRIAKDKRSTMETLTIRNCHRTSRSSTLVEHIAELLRSIPLERLSVTDGTLLWEEDEDLSILVEKGCKNTTTLKSFNLSSNGIGTKGCIFLATQLLQKNLPHLQEFSLYNNQISDLAAMECLAHVLEHSNTTITYLDLLRNPITHHNQQEQRWKQKIHFFLTLNRCGRRNLVDASYHKSWTHDQLVQQRIQFFHTVRTNYSQLYSISSFFYILQLRPDILLLPTTTTTTTTLSTSPIENDDNPTMMTTTTTVDTRTNKRRKKD